VARCPCFFEVILNVGRISTIVIVGLWLIQGACIAPQGCRSDSNSGNGTDHSSPIELTQRAVSCDGISYSRPLLASNAYPLIVCEGCTQPVEGVSAETWEGGWCGPPLTPSPSPRPTSTKGPTPANFWSFQDPLPACPEGEVRAMACLACGPSALRFEDSCPEGCVGELLCEPFASLVTSSPAPSTGPSSEPSRRPTGAPTVFPFASPAPACDEGSFRVSVCSDCGPHTLRESEFAQCTPGCVWELGCDPCSLGPHEQDRASWEASCVVPSPAPTPGPVASPTCAVVEAGYAAKADCPTGQHRVIECLPCSSSTLAPNYLCAAGLCVMEHWCAACGDYYPYPVGNEESICA
jgi:hypothetical protein